MKVLLSFLWMNDHKFRETVVSGGARNFHLGAIAQGLGNERKTPVVRSEPEA